MSLKNKGKAGGLLGFLTFLAADLFSRVTDTLALVRLGRIIAADIRSELSDALLVDSLDENLGVVRDSDLDIVGDRVEERVAVAEA